MESHDMHHLLGLKDPNTLHDACQHDLRDLLELHHIHHIHELHHLHHLQEVTLKNYRKIAVALKWNWKMQGPILKSTRARTKS